MISLTGRRPPRRARVALAAAALGLAFAATSCGSETDDDAQDTSAGLTITDAWVRATTGTDDPSMTAAFMVIDNGGDEDVTLEGASSSVAGMTQLHEMTSVDGEMVMQEVEGGIVISAGAGKVLEPGGYHVMLMDLTGELAPGDEVELRLSFSDGTEEELTLPVKEFTEEEGHYHSPGTEDDHAHGGESDMEPSSS